MTQHRHELSYERIPDGLIPQTHFEVAQRPGFGEIDYGQLLKIRGFDRRSRNDSDTCPRCDQVSDCPIP